MSAVPDPPPQGRGAPADGDSEPARGQGGILPDDHWSKTRDERNAEALEFLRERAGVDGV